MKLPLPLSIAAALVSAASAAQPEHELTPEIAVKLIQSMSEAFPQQISVGVIMEGTIRSGPFEATHSRRVVAVHPVPEEGRRVRRMKTYDFFWNPDYGWFAWEKGEDKGGDSIRIWSEKRGTLVVK